MANKKELARVRSQIKAKGLKIGYLADRIGVHRGTLSSYLTGKREMGLAARISLLRELELSEEAMRAS